MLGANTMAAGPLRRQTSPQPPHNESRSSRQWPLDQSNALCDPFGSGTLDVPTYCGPRSRSKSLPLAVRVWTGVTASSLLLKRAKRLLEANTAMHRFTVRHWSAMLILSCSLAAMSTLLSTATGQRHAKDSEFYVPSGQRQLFLDDYGVAAIENLDTGRCIDRKNVGR